MPAASRNAASASSELPPCGWRRASSCASARSASSSIPSSSAVRSRVDRLVEGQRAAAAARGERGCSRSRARASPSGAAAAKWCARSASARRPERSTGLERLADAQVQLGAAQAAQPVVEGAAHELVREAIGQPARRAAPRSCRCARPRRAPRAGRGSGAARCGATSSSNSGPADGRQLEQVARCGLEARQALADDLAHALRRRELAQRPREPQRPAGRRRANRSRSAPPQLADEERVAARSARRSRAQLRGRRCSTSPPADARTNSATSLARSGRRAAAARCRRSAAGRRGSPPARPAPRPRVSRKVATSSMRASAAARARWRSSSSVGTSAQCPSSSTSSTGRRRPTPRSRSATAVWSRWRSVSGSAATGGGSSPTALAQVRQQARELAAGRAEVGAQQLGGRRRGRAARAPRRTGR